MQNDLEQRLISISNKDEKTFGEILTKGISTEDFVIYTEVFEFVKNYYFKYNSIPAKSVVTSTFPGFSFVEDVDMLSYAIQRNVVPVSPATLYAYLCVLMDSVKRIEFSKNEKNVLQNIKQSLNIFDGAKSSVDRATKQMRDSLTNAEGASKKIQDCLDNLNNLVKGEDK